MSKLLGLAKTAYQSDTPKKYLVDAATLYKNISYDATTGNFTGELIGATNGGIEIDLEQKYRDVEVDGTYWTPVKGNKVLSSTIASAKTSIKEFTAETLRLSINGDSQLNQDPNVAPEGYSIVTGKRYVEDSDYIENLGMVGKLSGTEKPIIVIFDNCLATAGAKIKTEDDKEAEIPVEFTAHASYDQLVNDVFPYRILFPTMGGVILDSIKLTLKDVNVDAQHLTIGQHYDVLTTPVPAQAQMPEVSYLSTDKDVATINQAGTIVTTGLGSAEIIGVTKDGQYSTTLPLTVEPAVPITAAVANPTSSSSSPIEKISGNKGTIKVGTGTGTANNILINLTPAAANNYTVSYSSDSSSVTIDPVTGDYEITHTGVATTAKITATFTNLADMSTVTVDIYFLCKLLTTSFTVAPATIPKLSLAGTKTAQLTVTQSPAGANEPVTYAIATGGSAIASVSSSGLVTGLTKGETDVEITVQGLQKQTRHVKVVD